MKTPVFALSVQMKIQNYTYKNHNMQLLKSVQYYFVMVSKGEGGITVEKRRKGAVHSSQFQVLIHKQTETLTF